MIYRAYELIVSAAFLFPFIKTAVYIFQEYALFIKNKLCHASDAWLFIYNKKAADDLPSAAFYIILFLVKIHCHLCIKHCSLDKNRFIYTEVSRMLWPYRSAGLISTSQ